MGAPRDFAVSRQNQRPPKPKCESLLSPLGLGAAARPAAGRRGAPTITFPTVIL